MNQKSDFPLCSFQKLYHVGTLNPKNKQEDSHEGNCLSVSTHPEAWMRITPLSGKKHTLTKEQNQFLDFHSLQKHHKNMILEWAEKNKYIKKSRLYKVSWYDDEEEDTMYSIFRTKVEALEECEEDATIEVLENAYCGTTKLEKRMKNEEILIDVLDFSAIAYAEDVLQIDGVWWNDRLDISNYSAPRGGIVPSKISEWSVL